MDFVSDAFADKGRFRILVMFDDLSRCRRAFGKIVIAGAAAGNLPSGQPDGLVAQRGRPKTVVIDDGTELTSVSRRASHAERLR